MNRIMNMKNFFAPSAWRLGGSARRAATALLLCVLTMTVQTAWAQSGNWSDYKAASFSTINESAKTISITSEAELALLAYNTCAGTDYSGYTITLTRDLNMSILNWDKPIGSDEYHSFSGTFNGDSKTISGINISSSGDNKGLFGFVGRTEKPGIIQNLTLANSTITGANYVGGIVGYLLYGTVSNCHVLSSVSILASGDGSNNHGGIVGQTYPNKTVSSATIENCTSAALVTDNGHNNCSNYGGIVGYNHYYSDTYFSKVTGCFYYGTAVSASSDAGAIVGYYYRPNGISNCYYNCPSTISGIGYGNTDIGTTRVYTVTCSTSGLSTTGTATYTHNGTHYFAAGATVTVSAPSLKIYALEATTGSISNVSIAADKHSATFTMGSSDVTLALNQGIIDNGLTWSLGGTNYTELTISGTGTMQNFEYSTDGIWKTKAPWGTDITSVTIGDGVTSIGNYAFIGCENLASITIGSGVTSIGIGAVNHCDQMTTVTLPASVTTIAYAAFENCQMLQTIYINHDGEVSLTGNNDNAFNAPLLQYIAFPSPAGALANTKETGNWARYKDNIRARFGNQLFLATNEGGIPAYAITNATDLTNLATAVNGGSNGSGQTFRQTANISVGSTFPMIGSNNTNSFGGIYDGNHKTLTFNYTATGDYTAPFRYVKGTSAAHAVIRDLTVSSTITSTDCRHPAGLVANQQGYLDVTGCNVAAYISTKVGTNNPTDLYPAGLVSQVASGAQLTVSGCFAGGNIVTNGKYAAGYVGTIQGSATITNSISNITIRSSVSGDGTHGGFIGAQSNTLTIEGCVFNGKLLSRGTKATTSCGGFVGWKGGTVNISNSLYAPAALIDDETWIASDDSYTFSRRSGTNITNCYYTQAFGEAQGTAVRTVSAGENVTTCTVSPVDNSTATYDVSGITAYNDGLVRNGNFYYGNTDVVSLTLAHQEREGYNFDNYTASAGTLTGTTNPYSLTMPDSDVTINAIYTNVCPVPTNLTATDLTSTTATLSWSGEQDSYNVRYRTAGTENYTLFEDFENLGNELPEDWTFDGTYWIPKVDGGHNSTYYLCLLSHDEYLITPKMDLSGQGQAILNFWYRNVVSGASVQFEVYYRTEEDDDAWIWLWSSEGGHAEWTEKTINLPDLSADYQIGFYIGDGGPDICFDDIAITGTSLHPIGEWQTVNNIAATTTTVTGLMPETPYEWQVQGLGCNGNGTSEWSEAGTFTTLPLPAVSYIDENGVVQYKQPGEYTVLTGGGATTLGGGWYVVNSDITYTGTVTLGGDVHLILADGCTLNIGTEDARISSGSCIDGKPFFSGSYHYYSLTIYGQANQSGALNAYSNASYINAVRMKNYTQHGGNVTIDHNNDGIALNPDDDLILTRGTLTATVEGSYYPAIYSKNLTFSGGNLTANGDIYSNATLGWTSATDFIKANSYNGTVNIASGKAFTTDGTDIYSGSGVTGINGKTLTPAVAVTLADGITATGGIITSGDNMYAKVGANATVSVAVPEGYIVSSITVTPAATVVDLGNSSYSFTVPAEDVSVSAQFDALTSSVAYIDENGVVQYKQPGEYTVLTGGGETTLAGGWYVVNSDITYTGTVTLGGNVNIILADDAQLNLGTSQSRLSSNCIIAPDGKYSLTIYGQANQSGHLSAYNSSSSTAVYVKSYTQHGGNVTIDATGSTSLWTHDNGNFTLSRGNLTVNSSSTAIRVDPSRSFYMSGGSLTVTSSGGNAIYSNRIHFTGGDFTAIATNDHKGISGHIDELSWTNLTDHFYVSSITGSINIASGKTFYDENGNTYTNSNANTGNIAGKNLRPYDCRLTLYDTANNSTAIASANGKIYNVTMSGRKLWKDGAWNTLVLPFPIANIEAEGCPLKGATVRELNDASITGTTLTLNFKNATTAIAAGVPYIVKWADGEAGQYTQDPVFQGVTIDATTHSYDNQAGGDTNVRFIGTYDQKTVNTEDQSILFLGAANTLYYPSGQSATTIGACRAYFKIGSGTALARQLTAFNLNFADGESQGIVDNKRETITNNHWYTLDGVRLDGKPTRKGVYIHGGRKVVIK